MEGVPGKGSEITKLASHLIGQAEKAMATTTKKKRACWRGPSPTLTH